MGFLKFCLSSRWFSLLSFGLPFVFFGFLGFALVVQCFPLVFFYFAGFPGFPWFCLDLLGLSSCLLLRTKYILGRTASPSSTWDYLGLLRITCDYLRARSPEPGARSPEPGAQSPEPGSWEPEAQSAEHGAWSPEPGAQSPDPGAWSAEPGARSPDPGVWSWEPNQC